MRAVLAFSTSILLAGCGPSLKAEAIAGRTILITNESDDTVTIQRIVANDSDGRAECVDQPGATLSPGRSYTTTFFYCDEVREVDVETDRGRREMDFN